MEINYYGFLTLVFLPFYKSPENSINNFKFLKWLIELKTPPFSIKAFINESITLSFCIGDNSWQAIDSSSIKNGNDVKVQANSHGAVVTGIITANSLSIVDGTTSINKHSVGIGTTTTTGRNAGVGTAYGDLVYNTTTDKVQIWHTSNVWYNLDDWSSTEGYYENTTAASSDGLIIFRLTFCLL